MTLVSGPTHLTQPKVAEVVSVRSAREMHDAVMYRAPEMDAVVMSAAVADYTPKSRAAQKVAKSDGLEISLERTPDILAELGRLPSRSADRPVLVGFAAETPTWSRTRAKSCSARAPT